MIRTVALFAYGAGSLLAAFLVLAALSAISSVWSKRGHGGLLEGVAYSFLPMLTLMISTFLAQRHAAAIRFHLLEAG